MGVGRAMDRTVMGRVLAVAVLVGAAVLSLVAVAPAPVRAAVSYYVGSNYGGPVRISPSDTAGCTNSNNLTCTLRGALSLVVSGDTVRFSANFPAVATTITLTDRG